MVPSWRQLTRALRVVRMHECRSSQGKQGSSLDLVQLQYGANLHVRRVELARSRFHDFMTALGRHYDTSHIVKGAGL